MEKSSNKGLELFRQFQNLSKCMELRKVDLFFEYHNLKLSLKQRKESKIIFGDLNHPSRPILTPEVKYRIF